MAERTQAPFREALPSLLFERSLSLRELSRRLAMDPAYLSRIRRGQQRLPDDLPARVAVALGLPEDYFPEAREALILEAVRSRPAVRERVYEAVADSRSRRKREQTPRVD